jgi:hypothetical protein
MSGSLHNQQLPCKPVEDTIAKASLRTIGDAKASALCFSLLQSKRHLLTRPKRKGACFVHSHQALIVREWESKRP